MVIVFSSVIYVALIIIGRNNLSVDTMVILTGLWLVTLALGTLCGVISNIWKEFKKAVSIAAKSYLKGYSGGNKDGGSEQ